MKLTPGQMIENAHHAIEVANAYLLQGSLVPAAERFERAAMLLREADAERRMAAKS